MIENDLSFKKKTAEFVSLCEVGAPDKNNNNNRRKDLSAEIFETDHIKFTVKSPPKSDARSLSLELASKEKVITPSSPATVHGVEGGEKIDKSDKKIDDSKKESVSHVFEEYMS